MSEASWLQKAGVTPVKGIVVGVLLVIFIAVCVVQFGGTRASVSVNRPLGNRKRHAAGESKQVPAPQETLTLPVPAEAKTRPEELQEVAVSWPSVPLEMAVQYDPFQLPRRVVAKIREENEKQEMDEQHREASDAHREEWAERRAQALAQLEKDGVELIVVGNNRVVAKVGSQTVQIGDMIAGFRVTEIRRDGIVLTEAKLP